MAHPIKLRVVLGSPHWNAWALCCLVCVLAAAAAHAQAPPPQTAPAPAPAADATPDKRQTRAAQDAYLAGAKKLDRDDLSGAEREFAHALALDPQNPDYAVAILVAREHRLTELVQQASKARLAGNPAQADTLLAEARAIDPDSPIVLEHSGPAIMNSPAQQSGATSRLGRDQAAGQGTSALTDRARLLSAGGAYEPWKLPAPVLEGALRLRPTDAVKSFHLRGDAQDALRDVAAAYGIRAVFDPSVERKNLRFDLEDQHYRQAMAILMTMTHVFAVPIDETSVLIARDTLENRQRLERQLQETIYLPGLTIEQINELANVVRNIFDVKQATVQTTLESMVVRAPEETLGTMNRTLQDLVESSGEVMLDVKLYEISTTHTRNIGGTIPTQAGIYNVDAAATALVNANQALVNEAIAQGLVSATASNLVIAAALIASGLAQSSLLASTIGAFGNGLTLTGITETGSVGFNLALNATDTRALDDIQMRVDDRQPATFKAGTRYPVTTSTYTTGLSTAASSLSGATINGVSVASLLAQYAGGSSTTVPQVSYEDLGVTLKATPAIQKTGRISLLLDLKIEALAGGSVNGIPVLASRAFTSDITVGDGESAMLVSNMNRTETSAVTGIPGLSELPGFQMSTAQDAEKDTGQLIVLITPHVVRRRSNMVAGPRIIVRTAEASANAN